MDVQEVPGKPGVFTRGRIPAAALPTRRVVGFVAAGGGTARFGKALRFGGADLQSARVPRTRRSTP